MGMRWEKNAGSHATERGTRENAMGILESSDALECQQQQREDTPLLLVAHAVAVNGDASGTERDANQELDAEHLASYVHARVRFNQLAGARSLLCGWSNAYSSLCVLVCAMHSDGKTFASAIISFLGSGVLGFPFAFKQTGILVRHIQCDHLYTVS